MQRVLDLARRDRLAASRVVAEQTLQHQVELVCETPVALRSRVLDLLPEPEKVIPELPEAELCFTAKALGLEDAGWILEHATPQQLRSHFAMCTKLTNPAVVVARRQQLPAGNPNCRMINIK